MGFALWIEDDLAWAEGLHEYRPMGVAVIARTDRFRPRDFAPARPCRARQGPGYVGLFASLVDLNSWLARSQENNRANRAAPAFHERSVSDQRRS